MDDTMRARADELLRAQEGVAGCWQLQAIGISRAAIRHMTETWAKPHHGVWVSGHAPLSQRQRWWAAVATAPDTVLTHASAGAAHGFYQDPASVVIVARPGCGSRTQTRGLLVLRTAALEAADVRALRGLPTTAPDRTVVDLVGALKSDKAAARVVRDALRVGAVTRMSLEIAIRRYRGRRGVARTRAFGDLYADLPATRTKSDAELLALATLHGVGLPTPELNVDRAGFEADLSWPDQRLIVELDGPSFHQFAHEDAKRDARWRAAGWRVIRLSTDVVYDDPNRLIAVVRSALAR